MFILLIKMEWYVWFDFKVLWGGEYFNQVYCQLRYSLLIIDLIYMEGFY